MPPIALSLQKYWRGVEASDPISADDIEESVSTTIKMAKLIDKTVRADKER